MMLATFHRWRHHVACLLLVYASPALSALSAEDLAERIGVGDPALGESKARAAGCVGCHGGDAANTSIPRLDGQLAGYTLVQIERFKAGQRSHPQIARDASTPSLTDAEDIAAWYASAAPMYGNGAAANADIASLFEKGDRSRDVIACVSCHGVNGSGAISGSDSTPAIGGQSADYLRARLRTWRAGPQNGAPISVMNLITRTLGDAEIDALSTWLSQLQPLP
ncbi:c-type cytochrome [uncultured Nevskia sp.]|uniref:c-type cytochrome n=1 Tax=uncultured Nevskia sp. TaxID=228950 RepID=UPI0025F1C17A|nr:c-type cytochrome [uncultured Nevskia sp.]